MRLSKKGIVLTIIKIQKKFKNKIKLKSENYIKKETNCKKNLYFKMKNFLSFFYFLDKIDYF